MEASKFLYGDELEAKHSEIDKLFLEQVKEQLIESGVPPQLVETIEDVDFARDFLKTLFVDVEPEITLIKPKRFLPRFR